MYGSSDSRRPRGRTSLAGYMPAASVPDDVASVDPAIFLEVARSGVGHCLWLYDACESADAQFAFRTLRVFCKMAGIESAAQLEEALPPGSQTLGAN